MNVEELDEFERGLNAKWRATSSQVEWEGGVMLGDRILQELLGDIVVSTHSFLYFKEVSSSGDGFGDEGAFISSPSRVVSMAYEDGILETDYYFQISRTEFGDGGSPVARMPVSRFLAHVSLAVSFHARFVDETLDVWDTLQRLSVGYSRGNQLAKIRPDILLQLLHLDTEWTNGITRRELAMTYAAKKRAEAGRRR